MQTGSFSSSLFLLEAESPMNHQVWEFLLSGGIFMLFIVICSFIAVSVVIHRLLSLRKQAVLPNDVMEAIEQADRQFSQGDFSSATSVINRDNSVLARVARVALSPEHDNREEASEAVEAVAREEVLKMQTGLAVLEVVITISPLLGLLGTVSGLVSVFATFGDAGAEIPDPSILAAGIAKALNTTIGGLAVAVPTVVAHSYLSKRIEGMAVRMEVLMASLLHAYYRYGGGSFQMAAEDKAESGSKGENKGETTRARD
ncbi:MAG: MotA/TolQ/ExbB proton channel family protein [Verrucomicrobiota bacterium]